MADFFGEGVTDNVKIEAVPENQAGEDFLAQTQNEISEIEGDFFNTNGKSLHMTRFLSAKAQFF